MKRTVCLILFVTLFVSGCIVVPPGHAKKAVGVKSSSELKGDGVKVKVKVK